MHVPGKKLFIAEVGVDFMYLGTNDYLQIVDYLSKLIEIRNRHAKTSAAVISA